MSTRQSKKEKRAPTNPTGPVAWNALVLHVFKDMAAELGVYYETCADHKDFLNKCKVLGLVRANAMKEASKRKGTGKHTNLPTIVEEEEEEDSHTVVFAPHGVRPPFLEPLRPSSPVSPLSACEIPDKRGLIPSDYKRAVAAAKESNDDDEAYEDALWKRLRKQNTAASGGCGGGGPPVVAKASAQEVPLKTPPKRKGASLPNPRAPKKMGITLLPLKKLPSETPAMMRGLEEWHIKVFEAGMHYEVINGERYCIEDSTSEVCPIVWSADGAVPDMGAPIGVYNKATGKIDAA